MNSGCQAAEVDGMNRMVSQVAIKQLGMATMAVANEYTIKNWKASWTGAVV
jgi:predicted GIY-YIG superfamily endonuclease